MNLYEDKKWLENQLKTKSVEQIHNEFGFGQTTLFRWKKKHGLNKPLKNFQKKEWLKKELRTKTSLDISIEQGVSEATIHRWCKKFSLNPLELKVFKDKNWLKEKLIECNGSVSAISKKYHLNNDTLLEYCSKFGFTPEYRKRTFSLKESYFENIDTENKAYFLGFLMADGCVKKDLRSFSLGIQVDDIKILENLKRELNYGGEIKIRENEQRKNTATLTICSSSMCRDLICHGIVPRKTGKETLPDTVPKKLVRHFIRGFLDGDGYTSKKTIIFASKSLNILDSIRDIFIKNGANKTTIRPWYNKKTMNKMFYYGVYGKSSEKIFNYLYNNSNIYLQRKFDKFCQKYVPFDGDVN